MKKISLGTLFCLIFFRIAIATQQAPERNPFEFKQENDLPAAPNVQQIAEPLSKWSIKENDNKVIIMENIDDGQIRTIEIAPTEI